MDTNEALTSHLNGDAGVAQVGEDAAKLDGNEIWEWLFGRLEGDVPSALDDGLLDELAAHINCVFIPPRRAGNTTGTDDEVYEIGKRDGYEQAVQEIDEKTGGDGEYRYCTDHDPDRHTPTPQHMIARIVDRFNALEPASSVEGQEPAPADAKAWWCEHGDGSIEVVMWPDARDKLAARGYAITPLRPSPAVSAEVTVTFQERVAKAHVALFHDDPTDIAERRDRFGEEANELQQALGQTREDAHRLVDYTYDRPAGEPDKEIGAAALTLASLCVIGGYDMMACAEADLAALITPEKIAKVRAKRATRHGRGPLPGLDAALLAFRKEGE